ncbi:MAG TPA: DNA polymerase Y family protein [Roseiarcus sp.]
MTRRFLSLWFARLSTDRARARLRAETGRGHAARKDEKAAPLATIAKIKGAQRLVCVDPLASSLGLSIGLSLADARARRPNLIAIEAAPEEEARLLAKLADWCSRFTPLVALDDADGLMLDIVGVAHLFGGEEKMAGEIETRLAAQGLGVSLGIADTPRAAWALARFSSQRIAPTGLTDRLFAKIFHDLPVAGLGLDEKTVADLNRAGLRRIGDIALRPRAPIAARFGADVMSRLDVLCGLQRGAISPRFAAPDFSAERRFASAISRREDVEATIARLAEDLVILLDRQAKGGRRFEVRLFRVDGAMRRIGVGAGRPLNNSETIARLFRERLDAPGEDEIDAGYGIDLVRLSCLVAEPLASSQKELEQAHEGERERNLADLLDRLSARLGPRRVTRLEFIDTHIPEFAVAAIPASARMAPRVRPALLLEEKETPSRPLRLFERPELIEAIAEVPDGPPLRFKWRRVLHEIAAIEGPERIAAEWWRRTDALTRDYFRAEDTQGRRFWLYREGLYGRETIRAKWFLHGLFA